MKKLFFSVCFLLAALLLFSQPVIKTVNFTRNLDTANWFFRDGKNKAQPYEGNLPIVIDTKEDSVTIGTTFSLPNDFYGPLGIIFYKNNMSVKVYINNTYVETLGRDGENFFFQPYITRGVLIPEALLRPTNTLILICYNDTGTYKLRMVDFMDEQQYRSSMTVFNFLDIQLPRLCVALLLFVAMYCLFTYFNYRKKKDVLYLAFATILFSIYLLNVTISSSPINYVFLKAVLYSAFPLSMMFLFLFFRKFLGMNTGKGFVIGFCVIGILFSIGYYIHRTTAALDTWHSITLIYPVSVIVYALVAVIRRLKHDGTCIPILVGLVVALLFSAYDIYYFLTDTTPFILLQGVGFMAMMVGTFYAFSQDMANTNKQVAVYSAEMEKNKAAMDALFERIRYNTARSETASSQLNVSIEESSSLVTQYITSSEQITSNIEIQNRQVRSNKVIVDRIFEAIDLTSDMISQHAELVNVTVESVRELADHIHTTDMYMQNSQKTLTDLNSICTAADHEVADSARAVNDLANYSENINEIVKSISNLSANTNILAINAAIEAARSGQAGKGFAVVAAEIRDLAAQSGTNAEEIKDILSTMVEKITNIQNQEERVSGTFRKVILANESIESSFREIFGVLERQREKNQVITQTVSHLIETVSSISEQTGAQKSSGDDLKISLELLGSISEAIYQSSQEQQKSNEELKKNLDTLRAVSCENLEVVSDLNKLTQ